eukprot:Nk52_evm28s248 gene=Nk52_evmTU28s248
MPSLGRDSEAGLLKGGLDDLDDEIRNLEAGIESELGLGDELNGDVASIDGGLGAVSAEEREGDVQIRIAEALKHQKEELERSFGERLNAERKSWESKIQTTNVSNDASLSLQALADLTSAFGAFVSQREVQYLNGIKENFGGPLPQLSGTLDQLVLLVQERDRLYQIWQQMSQQIEGLNREKTQLTEDLRRAQVEASREKESVELVRQQLHDSTLNFVELQKNFECEIAGLQAKLAEQSVVVSSAQAKEDTEKVTALEEALEKSKKELKRLKGHLIQVEDMHTEEALQQEQLISSLKATLESKNEELHRFQSVVQQSSSEASHRVNEVEINLQESVKDRERLEMKVASLQEENKQLLMSSDNLQVALEQFQADQEEVISLRVSKLNHELKTAKEEVEDCKCEVDDLKEEIKQAKSKTGEIDELKAIISEKDIEIDTLRDSLKRFEKHLNESHLKLSEALSSSDDQHVDKRLLKNLLVTYFKTEKKADTLLLMCKVLDCSDAEKKIMGVLPSGGGWSSYLTGWVPGLQGSGESSFNEGEGKESADADTTMGELFVQFLLEESRVENAEEASTSTRQASGASEDSAPPSSELPNKRKEDPLVKPTPLDMLIEPS